MNGKKYVINMVFSIACLSTIGTIFLVELQVIASIESLLYSKTYLPKLYQLIIACLAELIRIPIIVLSAVMCSRVVKRKENVSKLCVSLIVFLGFLFVVGIAQLLNYGYYNFSEEILCSCLITLAIVSLCIKRQDKVEAVAVQPLPIVGVSAPPMLETKEVSVSEKIAEIKKLHSLYVISDEQMAAAIDKLVAEEIKKLK